MLREKQEGGTQGSEKFHDKLTVENSWVQKSSGLPKSKQTETNKQKNRSEQHLTSNTPHSMNLSVGVF